MASGFIWNYFSHKKNQHHIRYLLLYLLNATPTQVNHDLTCCHNCRRDEGEEVNQDENRAGVCCKGKGWKDGVKHKRRKNQEDKERGGGMCPDCGEEEDFINSI